MAVRSHLYKEGKVKVRVTANESVKTVAEAAQILAFYASKYENNNMTVDVQSLSNGEIAITLNWKEER